jgi:hypothetical protein
MRSQKPENALCASIGVEYIAALKPLLVQHGLDPNHNFDHAMAIVSRLNANAFRYFAKEFPDMVRVKKEDTQNTLLHEFFEKRRESHVGLSAGWLVSEVINAGIDPTIKNAAGQTALDVARANAVPLPSGLPKDPLVHLLELAVDNFQRSRGTRATPPRYDTFAVNALPFQAGLPVPLSSSTTAVTASHPSFHNNNDDGDGDDEGFVGGGKAFGRGAYDVKLSVLFVVKSGPRVFFNSAIADLLSALTREHLIAVCHLSVHITCFFLGCRYRASLFCRKYG